MKSALRTLALVAATAVPAGAETITVESSKSVAETMDALEAAVSGAGATIFARVDHAKGAADVEMTLEPAQTLIFGNPKLGTPAMQDDLRAALYLPLKVAVVQTEGGAMLIYDDPADMLSGLSISPDAPYLAKMNGALEKLTAKAAQ